MSRMSCLCGILPLVALLLSVGAVQTSDTVQWANAVASVPTDSNITTSITISPRHRRQGLAGLEIAKDHNRNEEYPKSIIVTEYTKAYTDTPVSIVAKRKREAREHDFMLGAAPNTSGPSTGEKKVQPLSQRSRRSQAPEEEGSIAAVGEPSQIAIQPTPFHTEVTLVPIVGDSHEFVDSNDNMKETRNKHKDKTMSKREVYTPPGYTYAPRRTTGVKKLSYYERLAKEGSSGLAPSPIATPPAAQISPVLTGF